MSDSQPTHKAAPASEISASMKLLAKEWEVSKGLASQPLNLKLAHLLCFTVQYGSVMQGVNSPYAVFQFFAPECMAEDKVREARRRSYMLHNRFGETFAAVWKEVVGDQKYTMERIEGEQIEGPAGLGTDSWCLRAWGRELTDVNAALFSALLERFDEALKQFLALMLR